MDSSIKYLDKYESGLPFDIIKDNHFPNYYAKHENGMMEKLTVSDIISVNLLMEIKRQTKNSNNG